MTVVLKGDKRRPSGQGPGARVLNGLSSQHKPASRAARPRSSQPRKTREAGTAGLRPPPRRSRGASPKARTPPAKPRHRAAANPSQPATRSPAQILAAARPPPAKMGFNLISTHSGGYMVYSLIYLIVG